MFCGFGVENPVRAKVFAEQDGVIMWPLEAVAIFTRKEIPDGMIERLPKALEEELVMAFDQGPLRGKIFGRVCQGQERAGLVQRVLAVNSYGPISCPF